MEKPRLTEGSMRLLIALLLMVSAARADTYCSETMGCREKIETENRCTDDGCFFVLTVSYAGEIISEGYGVTAGTGIPYRGVLSFEDGSVLGRYRMVGDDLLYNMVFYYRQD